MSVMKGITSWKVDWSMTIDERNNDYMEQGVLIVELIDNGTKKSPQDEVHSALTHWLFKRVQEVGQRFYNEELGRKGQYMGEFMMDEECMDQQMLKEYQDVEDCFIEMVEKMFEEDEEKHPFRLQIKEALNDWLKMKAKKLRATIPEECCW